jgi:transcriptional regulator with XRE-family HTH domain
MMRERGTDIDKKVGSTIRIQRLKLRMSQTELGEALGVAFQQIQKYENGTNAVASMRIPDLCRALEITPNDLFGSSSKADSEVARLSSWTTRTALKLEAASPAMRHGDRCHAQHGTEAVNLIDTRRAFGLNSVSKQRNFALVQPGRGLFIGRLGARLAFRHRQRPFGQYDLKRIQQAIEICLRGL